MRLPLVIVATALVVCAAPAGAQDAGAFARYPLGARALGMGGALTADLSGTASPFHNPALAPYLSSQALDVSAGLLPFDRELQSLQISAPLRPRAGIAAGVVHAAVRDIDGRDPSGYPTGLLSTDEYAFFVAFGARFSRRVTAGAGLRLYRSDLAEELKPEVALGLSLGLAARLTDALALGLAVDDLLARYTWDASALGGGAATDRFPTRVRLGASYALAGGRGTLAAEGEALVRSVRVISPAGVEPIGGTPVARDTTEELSLSAGRFRLGGEVWLAEPFAVRLGYDRLGNGSFGDAAPSAGFAVRQRLGEINARLDYAAILEGQAAGLAHFVTLHVEL